MADCTVELPQVIIILVILIVIFLFVYKNKENMNDNKESAENKKTSEMYIPNCNFLTDKDICEQTRGCYYRKNGCRYDWTKLQ